MFSRRSQLGTSLFAKSRNVFSRLKFKAKTEGLLPFLVRRFAAKSFLFFEKFLSLHLTPAHFYSPIPTLSKIEDTVFEKIYSTNGLNIDSQRSLELATKLANEYASEFIPKANSGLSQVDAFMLYAMIRSFRFPSILEIGAGDTTHIILKALEKNSQEGISSKLISVEPYPRNDILEINNSNFELVVSNFEELDPGLFSNTDFIFIDSSHVSKLNSDVNSQILEMMPIVKVNAIIHWHDIVFPRNYWKDWSYNGNQFWNESYLLHAFMLFNESFSILWPSQFIQTHHSSELKSTFPFFKDTHRLTSFWIQRTK